MINNKIANNTGDTTDRQTYHHHHRRHQENNILVPTPVQGFVKEKYSLLPEHHDQRMKRRCSHFHLLNFNIHTYRLCAGGPKNKKITIIIILAVWHLHHWAKKTKKRNNINNCNNHNTHVNNRQ